MARLIFLWLLLVAPCLAERHEERFFTLQLPAGWQSGRDATGVFFRATPPLPQPNVWIMVVQARLQGTLSEYLERSRAGWALSSAVTMEPDGTIVLVNPAARQWKIVREHLGVVYVVTCTAPASNYASWEPQYRQVLASFGWRQPATDKATFRTSVDPFVQALLALPPGAPPPPDTVEELRKQKIRLRMDWDPTIWKSHPTYVLLMDTADGLTSSQNQEPDPEIRSDAKKYWAEFLSKRDTLGQAFAELR